MWHSHARVAIPLVALSLASLTGCGGSSEQDDVQRQQLVERQIAQERREAARQARQEERIRRLEQELARSRKSRRSRRSTTVVVPAQGGSAAAAASPASTGDDWPGGSGFTVVLASEGSVASARATQRRASDAGLDAGVLSSSSYGSLRPGYWVVFSGSYSSQAEAAERQGRARSLGFGDAYVRFVAP
jgi:hypothetical protein